MRWLFRLTRKAMKKKPFNGVERDYRVDFVHVIPATIYMFMSQGFEKTGIPEGAPTGLHLFENSRDIVGQFSFEPSPVVQEFMPPEKPCGGVDPIENTIERGQLVWQPFRVKIVQLTNSLGKDASWRCG